MNDAQLARQLHQAGRLPDAEAAYRVALSAPHPDAGLCRDFGVLLMQSGRLREAVDQFRCIPQQHPAFPFSLVPRALCERDSGLPADALATAEKAVIATPNDPIGWLLHGSLLVATGALGTAEASLRRCLRLAPEMAEARHFLGECLQQQGKYREAIFEYQHALRTKPQEALNIALCAELMGDMSLARQYYEHAIKVLPTQLNAHARLLHLLSVVCDFPARDALRARIHTLLERPLAAEDKAEPFLLCYQQLDPAAYLKVLRHYAAQYPPTVAAAHTHADGRDDRRIHIGYLSADFDKHAVGHLVRDLFAAHDHQNFKISGFSLSPVPEDSMKSAERGFDSFFQLDGLPDDQAVSVIAGQNVDVLFDLGGYTKGARPSLLAARPARIQLGWLGFISPHEVPWLDAIILDEVVQPQSEEWIYSDRVIRLHSPLLPGIQPAQQTQKKRADFDLPEVGPLLVSLNNTYKLSAELISAWAEILSACPAANLAIYAPKYAQDGLAAEWQRCGGDIGRLTFLEKIDRTGHVDRMQCCDLMLDAFDYSAGATAIDAVAAGLPLLCIEGSTPVSRMSASINHYLEMPQLVAASRADYIAKAISIMNDENTLSHARKILFGSSKRRHLLDPRRVASELETICLELLHNRESPHES